MTVKLLSEHPFGFLSLKGDCTGLSESTLVKNATLLEITFGGSIIMNRMYTEGKKFSNIL